MMKCRAIPYEGTEPYIFLSYSHKDAHRVYPLLEQMVRDGCRVWYDDGNHPGDDWPENIANHLHQSLVCIAMLTEHAGASHNCRSEISFALECGKKVVPVMLEDFPLPFALRMQLSTLHRVRIQDYPSNHALLQKLYEIEDFKSCRGEPGSLQLKNEETQQTQMDVTGQSAVTGLRDSGAERNDQTSEAKVETSSGKQETQGVQIKAMITELTSKKENEPEKIAEESKKVKKVSVKVVKKSKDDVEAAAAADAEQSKDPQPGKEDQQTENTAPEAVLPETNGQTEPENEAQPAVNNPPETAAEQPQTNAETPEISAEDPDDGDEERTVYVSRSVPADVDDEDDDDRTVMAPRLSEAVLMRLSDGSGHIVSSALTSLGRSRKKCDIVLEGNSGVSNHHADIIQYKGKFCLRDAGSLNGTFVNGVRLESDGEQELGNPGVFMLHDETLVLIHGQPAQMVLKQKYAAVVRNVETQEAQVLTKAPLLLDRNHKWPNGTLDDLEIHRKAHAQILQSDGAFYLEDRGSANGTFLNGNELSANSPSLLNNGDQIRLGKTILEFGFVTF